MGPGLLNSEMTTRTSRHIWRFVLFHALPVFDYEPRWGSVRSSFSYLGVRRNAAIPGFAVKPVPGEVMLHGVAHYLRIA